MDADSGVIDDAGIMEDASVLETDASIPENDAGNEENDAGVTDDAGSGEEATAFISIPAGSFVLSHETAVYNSGDKAELDAFELKKTPVTVAEFEKCVTAGKCTPEHYRTHRSSSANDKYCNYNRGDEWLNHPMNCVNWNGAREYCAWIGGRLPTEEEREYMHKTGKICRAYL